MNLEKLTVLLDELAEVLDKDDELTEYGKSEVEQGIASVRGYIDDIWGKEGEK